MRRSPLVLLVLLALLCFVPVARALTLPGPAGFDLPEALAAPAEEEDEAASSEEEGIEGFEEECVEEEPGECEEDEGGPEAPAECLLTTVRPTAFASGNSDRVRLQVRYTASEPTAVKVEYGLHGAKGSLFLGSEKKRLAKKGVLTLSRKLTESQVAKVLAARDFTVRLRVLAAPRWCGPYFDRHLDVRRATPRGLTWLPSE
ncbi:MAG TPA: hypothetical protein VFY48_07920 [Solirubrobacterales bacterium]|nr:hypothetical protein [Solirubrobacterales bacterium]